MDKPETIAVIVERPTVAGGQVIEPSGKPQQFDAKTARLLVACNKARLAPVAASEPEQPKRRGRPAKNEKE